MTVHPCPICRRPVTWETTPSRPFCSERCRVIDLGAWGSGDYRIPEDPALEAGEGWSEGESSGGTTPP